MFYEVLGEAITAIDGYTGTLPPYERAIVLAPPNRTRVRVLPRPALPARSSTPTICRARRRLALRSASTARVEQALLDNPHGNGDEQTPLVVLNWRGAGENPLNADR